MTDPNHIARMQMMADEIERLRKELAHANAEADRLARRNTVLVNEIDDARAVRDALYRGEG